MPVSKCKGGSVGQRNAPNNVAAVLTAESTQTKGRNGNWVLTLTEPPRASNFGVGMTIDYNSKSTHNPNSNNVLQVTSVVGPAKYKATGPYPING
ncbi:MAG TPA: hypothetical protein VF759_00555 [Allosphingosinicella sp.]|jgi:hypothetical protein